MVFSEVLSPGNAIEKKKMPMKEWFRQLQPMQMYIILGLTIALFIIELSFSHVTHSLTLLIDSYHTLCNILALSASMISVKYGKKPQIEDEASKIVDEGTQEILSSSVCSDKTRSIVTLKGKQQENKLKNTFGWARIDVVGMLVCGVLLASFSFSILIQSLQILFHIDHHDEMHHAILVFGIGALGLLLNVICYVLIGGYTFNQGSFLHMTDKGCVVLENVVASDSRERRLSRTKSTPPPQCRQRQRIREVLRDTVGCLFVMVCAVLVYFNKEDVAKFIDPALSMLSATILMILSYPYLQESCLILLQTIPDTINIDSLKTQLTQHFPDIINVHDLHVWQLTANKVISTAHIIFQNPTVYLKITDRLTEFFQEQGITQVTIQPEFFTKTKSCESINNSSKSSSMCLMQCTSEDCKDSHCCPDIQPKTLSISSKWKSLSKELSQSSSTVDLISVKIDTSELPTNIKVGEKLDIAAKQTDTQTSNDKEENEKCADDKIELPKTDENKVPKENDEIVIESSTEC